MHTEHEISRAIADSLCGCGSDFDEDLGVMDARQFDEAGVMTSTAGFVLTLEDGCEYQVTVVRSRSGR